jgi:hypothetical protein
MTQESNPNLARLAQVRQEMSWLEGKIIRGDYKDPTDKVAILVALQGLYTEQDRLLFRLGLMKLEV